MLQHQFVSVFDPVEADSRRRQLLALLLKPIPQMVESLPDSPKAKNVSAITPPTRRRSRTKGRARSRLRQEQRHGQ